MLSLVTLADVTCWVKLRIGQFAQVWGCKPASSSLQAQFNFGGYQLMHSKGRFDLLLASFKSLLLVLPVCQGGTSSDMMALVCN